MPRMIRIHVTLPVVTVDDIDRERKPGGRFEGMDRCAVFRELARRDGLEVPVVKVGGGRPAKIEGGVV